MPVQRCRNRLDFALEMPSPGASLRRKVCAMVGAGPLRQGQSGEEPMLKQLGVYGFLALFALGPVGCTAAGDADEDPDGIAEGDDDETDAGEGEGDDDS